MAGTQFSSDSSRAGPGRPPSGAQDRRLDRQQRRPASRGPAKGRAPGGAPRDGAPHLGFPSAGQAAPAAPEPQDFRHVQLLSQHVNMQGLGREAPFGIRASLTGEYREILDRSAGQVPFDIFEDA